MTSYEMTDKEYDHLYKRYLARSPRELLELAGMKEGDRVLDLCAGANGRATKEAIKMGASFVVPVDSNPQVKLLHRLKKHYVDPICQDIGGFLHFSNISKSDKFNIVICQQGINYWFNRRNFDKIGSTMKKGGVFVFNTFNKKPPVQPTFKKYELDGLQYIEVVWLVDNMVKHVQIVEGCSPHFTEFKWVPPEEFRDILNKSAFEKIEIKTDKNTDIYVCRRRSKWTDIKKQGK